MAQRRDISSPEVVAEFARRVGDENLLNYLYCLTVADICGTNDTEWNSYKDTLLRTLYFEARDALRKGLENPPDLSLHIRENQKRAMEILTAMGNNPLDIFKIWTNLRPEYFIRYLPEQIAWHTQNIINLHLNQKRKSIIKIFHKKIFHHIISLLNLKKNVINAKLINPLIIVINVNLNFVKNVK